MLSRGLLLALVETGLAREGAYALVQRNAMKVWEEGEKDFLGYLLDDAEVYNFLGRGGIMDCFDQRGLLDKVDHILSRVFNS